MAPGSIKVKWLGCTDILKCHYHADLRKAVDIIEYNLKDPAVYIDKIIRLFSKSMFHNLNIHVIEGTSSHKIAI